MSFVALCCVADARGQLIWTGGGADDNWSTPANWGGGVAPVSGPNLVVRFGADAKPHAIADGDQPWVLNRLEFFPWPSASGPVSFNLSGRRLSFQGSAPAIEVGTWVNRNVANDIEIAQGELSIRGPITITGAISGGGGLNVSSEVMLSNSNSYAGVTRVSGSTDRGLTVTHPQALGATSSGTVVAWGSSLELRGGITVAAEPLALDSGAALLGGGGSNTWTGSVTLLASRAAIMSRNIGDRLSLTGAVEGSGGSLTFSGDGDTLVSGSITNLMSYGITKNGSGTLTLSGTSSAIYGAYVESGTLHLAKAGALPTNTHVQLNPWTGSAVTTPTATLRIGEPMTLGGISSQSTSGTPIIDLTASDLTVDHTYFCSFAGRILGAGSMIKRGSGTWQVALIDDYLGALVVSDGALRIRSDASLGPVPIGPRTQITLDGGVLEVLDDSSVALHANRTVELTERGGVVQSQLTATNVFSIGGRVTGPGRLTKRGFAPVALSYPANDYSGGTTIESGVLQFDHPGAIGGTGGNVLIGIYAIATTSYELDQTLLDRIDPASVGVVALSGPSDSLLDFDTPRLKHVFLGAVGRQAFHGTIRGFEDIVRLTGAWGDLTLHAPQALAGTRFLEVGSGLGGTVFIANDNAFPGTTLIQGGSLWIGNFAFNCNEVAVRQQATLRMWQTELTAGTLVIEKGAVLDGCGTINAEVINHGTIIASCGELRFTAPLTSYGQITVKGDATLTSTAAVTNHGVVDLITSRNATLPDGFVNHGRIIGFGEVKVQSTEKMRNVFQMRVESLTGHRYWMQRSLSLSAPVWEYVGYPRDGVTGQDVYLFDMYVNGPQAFYRVVVDP